MRGPMRPASRPARADSSSITDRDRRQGCAGLERREPYDALEDNREEEDRAAESRVDDQRDEIRRDE